MKRALCRFRATLWPLSSFCFGAAFGQNVIPAENAKPGTPDWQINFGGHQPDNLRLLRTMRGDSALRGGRRSTPDADAATLLIDAKNDPPGYIMPMKAVAERQVHPARRTPSSTTASPSSLVNGGNGPGGSSSSTASDGRQSLVPRGVTTTGRFIRIGC